MRHVSNNALLTAVFLTVGATACGSGKSVDSGKASTAVPGPGTIGNPDPTTDPNTNPSPNPIPQGFDALFVVNGGGKSISVINTQTNAVATTITLDGAKFPHHISLSADGRSLLVADPGMDLSMGHGGMMMGGGEGKLFKVDAIAGKVLQVQTFDAPNHNAIFVPASNEVWTGQMAMPGSLLVLDANTLAIKKSIEVGDMPAEVSLSSDGKYVFATEDMSNSVVVIDAATKASVKSIAVGKGPVGAWPGPNKVMYVNDEAGKSLVAIDATTLQILRTYDLGFTPGMAAVVGLEVWVTDEDNGKVAFYMTGSTMKMGEVATGAGAHGIAFSNDGRTAYVTNQMADSVSVIDVANRKVLKNIVVGNKPNGLVFRKN